MDFDQVLAQPLTNYLTLGQPLCLHLLMIMGIPVLPASWNCCEDHMGNFISAALVCLIPSSLGGTVPFLHLHVSCGTVHHRDLLASYLRPGHVVEA